MGHAFRNLLISLAYGLLDGIEHGLGWQRAGILLLFLRDARCGGFHRLGHVLIALCDDLLHPRLRFDDTLHLSLVAVEHEEQICGKFETLLVSVAVILAWQLVAIASINNTLNIIPSPFYFRGVRSLRADVRAFRSLRAAHWGLAPTCAMLAWHSGACPLCAAAFNIRRKLMIQWLSLLLTV